MISTLYLLFLIFSDHTLVVLVYVIKIYDPLSFSVKLFEVVWWDVFFRFWSTFLIHYLYSQRFSLCLLHLLFNYATCTNAFLPLSLDILRFVSIPFASFLSNFPIMYSQLWFPLWVAQCVLEASWGEKKEQHSLKCSVVVVFFLDIVGALTIVVNENLWWPLDEPGRAVQLNMQLCTINPWFITGPSTLLPLWKSRLWTRWSPTRTPTPSSQKNRSLGRLGTSIPLACTPGTVRQWSQFIFGSLLPETYWSWALCRRIHFCFFS